MKRVGNLAEALLDRGNLELAFCKAARGKWSRASVHRFSENLDAELDSLRRDLDSGRSLFGNYRCFRVFEPKERIIHAASFRERVTHHALMNVCEPVLERAAVAASFACRKGKGRHRAIEHARQCSLRRQWFLKMDVRKYFDSISHPVLLSLLERKFKDPLVLRVFSQIIGSHHTQPNRGLPIGSLTSQHLANFYLGALDRFCLEDLRIGSYCRYMDDFVLWNDDRVVLKVAQGRITAFLGTELGLAPKPSPYINQTRHGMDFLGARIVGGHVKPSRKSVSRWIRKVRVLERWNTSGNLSDQDLQQRVTAASANMVAIGGRAICRQRMALDLGGGHTAPTACSAAALGTTTPSTAAARTATGTLRTTSTTTTDSGLPELDPVRGMTPVPEDDPATVQSCQLRQANRNGPIGVSSAMAVPPPAKAPMGTQETLLQMLLPGFV